MTTYIKSSDSNLQIDNPSQVRLAMSILLGEMEATFAAQGEYFYIGAIEMPIPTELQYTRWLPLRGDKAADVKITYMYCGLSASKNERDGIEYTCHALNRPEEMLDTEDYGMLPASTDTETVIAALERFFSLTDYLHEAHTDAYTGSVVPREYDKGL